MDAVTEARLALVTKYAAKYNLDAALVCAVCEQESSWNQWAVRYEPLFFTRYIQPLLNNNTVHTMTEATCRATSYGYLQVMGQTAREAGFAGRYLTQLCEPDTGLDIGCHVLRDKLQKANGDWHQGLQFYNGGGDPNYADEVLARVAKYKPTED